MSGNNTFCFGTIRNNTALKLEPNQTAMLIGFGTIRNNTALKRSGEILGEQSSFGTIRNNTALKPRRLSFFYQIS